MNREEIIEKLRGLPYDPSQYWVVAGGAMALYGIRAETRDIDLGCTSEMADALERDGYLVGASDEGNRRFLIGGDIEVSENWLYGGVTTVDGFGVISIEGLIAMK